ncbi:MAG: CsgG/HfaB family protein, partial [Synergistales bacterium]|nr:CsgG/HfaB family protein [Synergistales bacterium]
MDRGRQIRGIVSLLFLFSLVVAAALPAGAATRIAVADFDNNAGEGSVQVTDSVRRAITDMLITELAKTPGLQVIERSRLEAIAKEQQLAASGMVD